MTVLSIIKPAARRIIPDGVRSAANRYLARKSYEKFARAGFGPRFTQARTGPVPPADIYINTNAKDAYSHSRKVNNVSFANNTYVSSGYIATQIFLRCAQEYGCDLSTLQSVFELGCGDGRVLRHLLHIEGLDVSGSDTRQAAVDWCADTLPHGCYFRNDFEPSLAFHDDDTINLAYAYSVFTHIPVDKQVGWLTEVRRILKPGGLFLVTVMNESLKGSLSEERRRELAECGRLEIFSNDNEAHLATRVGGSPVDVYQSRDDIVESWSAVMDVVAYRYDGLFSEPGNAVDGLGQDLVILRKRP